MQNQCVSKRQLARLGKDIERVLHARHAACAPRFVAVNTQAIRACRRDVVLIVMMREVDVVHDMFPLAISRHAPRLDGLHSEPVCS